MEGSTVWCAETSAAHFTVTTAWRYIDDRIRTLPLRPDPGPLEPALRSIRGGVPGVKVSIRDLPGRTVRFWVYAVDPHLCHTDVSFEVWAQDVLVGRYATARGAEANWSILGPFEVTVAKDRELARSRAGGSEASGVSPPSAWRPLTRHASGRAGTPTPSGSWRAAASGCLSARQRQGRAASKSALRTEYESTTMQSGQGGMAP